jgi:hypothetical protein
MENVGAGFPRPESGRDSTTKSHEGTRRRESGRVRIFDSPGRKAGDRAANRAAFSPIPRLPAWAVKEIVATTAVMLIAERLRRPVHDDSVR